MNRSDPRPTARDAERVRRRVATRVLVGVALGGVAAVVGATVRFARSPAAVGQRLGAGAVLLRGSTRLASIERRVPARGRGRLPLYLAPARGAVVDSARIGALTARLVDGTATGPEPVIMLVPPDSVRGLPLVARLVVVPGEPGLLVFGPVGPRP